MAECIIARGGKYGGDSYQPPIIADKHTILCTIRDSNNTPIENISVDCKDGDVWYNYTTNNKGQVLFITNSGSANITAQNYSRKDKWKFLDQDSAIYNVDAPVGLSTVANISLIFKNSQYYTSMTDNIETSGEYCYNGNYKIRIANYVNAVVVGGGGGSTKGEIRNNSTGYGGNGGPGGGGGGIAIQNQISVSHDEVYKLYIGEGGARSTGSYLWQAGSGGSSSAFGVSASGGGGGNSSGGGIAGIGLTGNEKYSGGNGIWSGRWPGINYFNPAYPAHSQYSKYSGGGGSGMSYLISDYHWYGGNPYGGNGGAWAVDGQSGRGPGGGGGGGGSAPAYPGGSADGASGAIELHFY